MTENQKNLKFSDFQSMLRENEGKPIYRREDDKYTLDWTIGGFIYHTSVTFKQIEESYKGQFGMENKKAAIEKFHDLYLKDAYEVVSSFDTKEEISLIEGPVGVRDQEEQPENKWRFTPVTELKNTIRKSTWMEWKVKRTIF